MLTAKVIDLLLIYLDIKKSFFEAENQRSQWTMSLTVTMKPWKTMKI